MSLKLRGAVVLTEHGREYLDISIRDGRISYLGKDDSYPHEEIDLSGLTVLPGFIDIHLHGGEATTP